ncbi:hypothetical protein EDB81DRAFT_54824 [Dactylonectria macrodidyma]|uniref:Uncharacterized protein n=1 Tax=Dactylonectria macrodidyma TaxID=307937 RepID=A0A9P9J4V6_9HYPO|nr:hypothetical protein EDB81DRAFT_54824 [Dactylonectria macrodidyma]
MASFVIVDVFTQERWTGNQLAIVALQDRVITHDHMQKIAREFNFSETVFIHGRHDGQDVPRISIFTPVNEMDFAGHPIIGTGHALFQKFLGDASPSVTPKQNVERVVTTKAGLITLQYDQTAGNVSAQVPHNVHIQTEPTPARAILDTQAGLQAYEAIMEDFYPTISIVKGVSYVLVDLSGKPDLFGAVKASASPQALLDDEWTPSFVGTMYYQALDDFQDQDGVYSQSLRVRMIAINLEDQGSKPLHENPHMDSHVDPYQIHSIPSDPVVDLLPLHGSQATCGMQWNAVDISLILAEVYKYHRTPS